MSVLYLVHIQAGLFKNLLDSVKDRVQEALVSFDENGMSFTTMDPAHVCLINCHLHSDIFEEYQMELTEENLKLGINITEFAKIMKCCASSDQIILSYNENEKPDVLSISFNGSTNASFDMALVDSEQQEIIQIPTSIEYQYQETITCQEFTKICKNLTLFTENVTIIRNNSGLVFEGSCENIRKASFPLALPTPFTETYQHDFSLKYLESFTKASCMANNIILKLGTESPLLVEYDISEQSLLQFYLAPKISSDD